MFLVTSEREHIRTLRERFERQYVPGSPSRSENVLRLQAALDTLDLETATVQQVTASFHISWISDVCSECSEYSTWSLRIGQEPDYESHTVWLCRACAKTLFSTLLQHVDDTPPDFHPV